jgi:hypothetical protein
MRTFRTGRPASIVLIVLLWPALVLAQTPAPKVGVVTTLQGQATVARPVLPQPIPLRFRDDVFVRDRVETKENSIVRVLLGGKALVTIRELSVFTITEEPGRAAVDLRSGKLAVGVAKGLLRAGEVIEIRTPNAVAGIRGSLVVAEVTIVGGVPRTRFTALEATLPITISPLSDPSVTIPLNPDQAVDVSGVGGSTVLSPVQSITPDQARAVAETASAPRPAEQSFSSPIASQISAAKMAEATQLASLIAPPPESAAAPSPPTEPASPVTPLASAAAVDLGLFEATPFGAAGWAVLSFPSLDIIIRPLPTSTVDLFVQTPEVIKETIEVNALAAAAMVSPLVTGPDNATNPVPGDGNGGDGLPSTEDGPDRVIAGTMLNLAPGQHLRTFSETSSRTSSSPVVQITESQVSGVDSLFLVESGADATLSGSLLLMGGTSTETSLLTTQSSVLEVNGRLATTTGSTLLDVASTAVVAGDVARVGPGGRLSLAGPLLTDVGGSYSVSADFLGVSGGGRLEGASPQALLQFSGSLVVLGGEATESPSHLLSVSGAGSVASLAGPLASFTNGSVAVVAGGSGSALVGVSSEGQLLGTTTSPLVSLSESLLLLAGGVPAVALDSGTATLGGFLRMFDAELLLASAPLLSAKAASVLTTSSDTVDLSLRARVSSLGTELIRLDASTLSVLSGALVNVAGGSTLSVAGDLVHLRNGATLNIFSGPLLNVTGGSFVTIGGALVNFGGTRGNTISVTNSLCPCSVFSGIPVALTNGALTANVSIGPKPIGNGSLGAVNLSSPSTAVIVVSGASSRVTIGAP